MRELRILVVLAVLATVASCAQLLALTDSAAERAGRAIAEYCKLPAESRAQFRAMVAERAAPHSAQINCAAP
jgi:hypothetical protein